MSDVDVDELMLQDTESSPRTASTPATPATPSTASTPQTPATPSTPYHPCILSGYQWVQELLNGHPERIRCELGVHKHVFWKLMAYLEQTGCQPSQNVTLEEQLAIFLYMCVTGLSVCHVSERFRRANEIISKYFKLILFRLSSSPFYSDYVRHPDVRANVPPEIGNDPKFYPFFKKTIGAIGGTHIHCTPTDADRQVARKGGLTQNCLAACTSDMRFTYVCSGWEGLAADSHDSILDDFYVPGKYYLADTGFPSCDALLIPYRGVRNGLAEWGPAELRPCISRELFNLRHALAHNVVDRIVGVLKARFHILVHPPEYSMEWQVRIPAALAALHNFIREHDPDEIKDFRDEKDWQRGDEVETLSVGVPHRKERQRANLRRNLIAAKMWDQYRDFLQNRYLL